MIDRDHIRDLISRYPDGELNQTELEEFLQALESDPEIKKEVELDRELTEFLRDQDLMDFLSLLDQTRFRRKRGFGMNCLLVAAIMLLFVAFGGIWIFQQPFLNRHLLMNRNQASSIHPTAKRPFTTQRPFPWTKSVIPAFAPPDENAPNHLLAACFKPIEFLESMVGVTMRSGSVILVAPKARVNLTRGDSLLFQWRVSRKPNVSLQVLNNRGLTVFSESTLEGDSFVLGTSEFHEGLYYWKFMDNDNLVTVGKMSIRR